jgi:hypothetical protein
MASRCLRSVIPGILRSPSICFLQTPSKWPRGRLGCVFVEEKGRGRLRPVNVGQRTGFEAEIVAGLHEGERIVKHPNDRTTDGVRIAERSEAS